MIVQPNAWSCLPTAFAITLGVKVQEIFDFLGHDGSAIWWPELLDPYNRRSFHIQEMIDFATELMYDLTEIQYNPCSLPDKPGCLPQGLFDNCAERFLAHLKVGRGVLTGFSEFKTPHAVAWDGFQIIDPNGTKYPLERFDSRLFYRLG